MASRRKLRLTLGVCAMEKKTRSKPMVEILRRLPAAVFDIVIFDERTILDRPVEEWPRCDCLIAFHSTGFPLDKASAYVTLRKPFVVNELRPQTVLRDRRRVYEVLAKAGVPTPRYAAMSRNKGPGFEDDTLEEFDDYIVVNGIKIEKPFVEKPVDSDDHNIHIYYPMSAGGGSKWLFRKVDNKSSAYFADEHKIRREGSFIYEEFVDTQGTDVKVYAVGPYYGHAEARKSPALDGIVMRGDDGKELRYPVILSWIEKDIAFKIYHAFKQTVCGFDILRTHDGKTLVCDVNGWSFVKKSRKYYDDCAALLAELMELRRTTDVTFRHAAPASADACKNGRDNVARTLSDDGLQLRGLEATRSGSFEEGSQRYIHNTMGHVGNSHSRGRLGSNTFEQPATRDDRPKAARQASEFEPGAAKRELRCVIAVVRHGDRTPKRKVKVPMRHARFIAVHAQHAKSPRHEAKICESKDLRGFAAMVRLTLEELDLQRESQEAEGAQQQQANETSCCAKQLRQLHDVLEQHVPSESAVSSSLSMALFSGIKLQLKPTAWEAADSDKSETAATEGEGDELPSPTGSSSNTGEVKVTELVLVLKWGGVLTELGVEHSRALGAHFRRTMYPASEDGFGLLRLHATLRP